MASPRAVVFDFDGVILQSMDIKTDAFAELFSGEEPEAARRIVDHHLANGGISRFEKFRWAYREVLKRPLTAEAERALGERFNLLVEEAVTKCAYVPGAREFLERRQGWRPFFVASGTPEEELRRIVERRGLSPFFSGVFGTPRKKAEILKAIATSLSCPAGELAMIGDAINDLDAARAVGARFIGVCAPGATHGFPVGTEILADLTRLDAALER